MIISSTPNLTSSKADQAFFSFFTELFQVEVTSVTRESMNLTRTLPSLKFLFETSAFPLHLRLTTELEDGWPHLPFLKFFQTRSTFLARSSNIVSSSFFYFPRLSFCYGHYFCPLDYPLFPFISFFFLI